MSTDAETFTLANGVAIPQVGFGTWQIPPGDAAYEATSVALDAGYRHIDTALAYGNEASVAETSVLPAANQIRWFIGNTQPATTAWCQERGVVVEGYSPLATGGLLDNAQLCEIAERHGRSAAQVALRYLLQKNVLPLPKSTTPARIRQNLELDFVLGSDDLAALDALAPTGPAGPFNS